MVNLFGKMAQFTSLKTIEGKGRENSILFILQHKDSKFVTMIIRDFGNHSGCLTLSLRHM